MIYRRVRRKKIPGEVLGLRTPARPWTPQELWADLHRASLAAPTAEGFAAYLASFRARLPCGECRAHWDALVRETPPGADLFAWTVDRHNAVNLRLSKPVLTVDAARALWTVDTPSK